MKRTAISTQPPVIPEGYTGKDFNDWRNKLQKKIDKAHYPSVTSINIQQNHGSGR